MNQARRKQLSEIAEHLQPPHLAGDPFRHAAGCAKAGDFAQHHWRALAELLQQLKCAAH